MIYQTPAEEFPQLYKTSIVADFPVSERRPLAAIKSLYKKNRYACLQLMEEGKMEAYATFLLHENVNCILLDYFAVSREMRGCGIGSRFLGELRNYWDTDGIIIESEMPSEAPDEKEQSTRERRIDFYTRNGAELSPYGWRIFSVDYRLLWLPVKRRLLDADIAANIQALYQSTMPGFLYRKVARLYMADTAQPG